MERARCERRHRHLEQWLTRGVGGRHSERVPSFTPQHNVGTLTRSKSLELLDDGANAAGIAPCKSLDELEIGDDQVECRNFLVNSANSFFCVNSSLSPKFIGLSNSAFIVNLQISVSLSTSVFYFSFYKFLLISRKAHLQLT